MKHTVAFTVSFLALVSSAYAEEPPFYANYNWRLNPGDVRIAGEDSSAAIIVGKKVVITFPSGLKNEEQYKTDGTYEYRQSGSLSVSAPSYEIHPSGLACIDAGTPPDKPFCSVYVKNGDRFFAIQHYGNEVFPVEASVED